MPIRAIPLPIGPPPATELNDPPLTYLQAMTLKILLELGVQAAGYRVIDHLMQSRRLFIDPSQVYGSIRKMRKSGFLNPPKARKSLVGGPPFKIYSVTAAGKEALQRTIAHHRAILEFLTK